MRRCAVTATVITLVLSGATAAPIGDPAPSASARDDPAQANWHGRHRGGGGGHGREGGNGDGSVVIGFPSPSWPEAPSPCRTSRYPTPCSIPTQLPGHGNEAARQPQPWPLWYYCDQPSGYYPYVKICGHDWQRLPIMPPPPGSGSPIAEGSWERCDDPAGYFPYVAQCRHQWVAIAASVPVPGDYPDGIAAVGQWYYCEDAKDYLPYVGSCPHVWRTIPAVPPPNVQSPPESKVATNPR